MRIQKSCLGHSRKLSRRGFLATGGAALSFSILPRHVLGALGVSPPSEKLNIGCIGLGSQGKSLSKSLGYFKNVNLAALCDVDEKYLVYRDKEYPGLPFYTDYRIMLEKEKGLDAVMIATPDHWHAPIAMMAMRLGKHVYVEKPMAHTIEETRLMGKLASSMKVVTQMGNSGHGGEGLRLTKEWIDAGAIGSVKEVYVWSDRPGAYWDTQGKRYPNVKPTKPSTLDWNLWQGPAQERAYHPDFTPMKWRGWYDYGCGALGDMMVHNADPAWYALDLGTPDTVEAITSETNPDSFPLWSKLTWCFKAKGKRGPVKVMWYDGGKLPPLPSGLEPDRKLNDNGIYFVGDKGVIMAPGWSGTPRLIPESAMKAFVLPKKTIPRSCG